MRAIVWEDNLELHVIVAIALKSQNPMQQCNNRLGWLNNPMLDQQAEQKVGLSRVELKSSLFSLAHHW